LGYGAERGVGDLLAFEILGAGDAGLLEHVDRVRRPRIDDGDELGGNLIIAAAENDRSGIGKPDLRDAGRDLFHRIRGPLSAHNGHIEIVLGVIAFVQGDEIIGVTSVVAEIRHERHLVGGMRIARPQGTCAERREQIEEVSAAPVHFCFLCSKHSAHARLDRHARACRGHPRLCAATKAWMAGPSPAMTSWGVQPHRKTLYASIQRCAA
jgi:hypothetical protein